EEAPLGLELPDDRERHAADVDGLTQAAAITEERLARVLAQDDHVGAAIAFLLGEEAAACEVVAVHEQVILVRAVDERDARVLLPALQPKVVEGELERGDRAHGRRARKDGLRVLHAERAALLQAVRHVAAEANAGADAPDVDGVVAQGLDVLLERALEA